MRKDKHKNGTAHGDRVKKEGKTEKKDRVKRENPKKRRFLKNPAGKGGEESTKAKESKTAARTEDRKAAQDNRNTERDDRYTAKEKRNTKRNDRYTVQDDTEEGQNYRGTDKRERYDGDPSDSIDHQKSEKYVKYGDERVESAAKEQGKSVEKSEKYIKYGDEREESAPEERDESADKKKYVRKNEEEEEKGKNKHKTAKKKKRSQIPEKREKHKKRSSEAGKYIRKGCVMVKNTAKAAVKDDRDEEKISGYIANKISAKNILTETLKTAGGIAASAITSVVTMLAAALVSVLMPLLLPLIAGVIILLVVLCVIYAAVTLLSPDWLLLDCMDNLIPYAQSAYESFFEEAEEKYYKITYNSDEGDCVYKSSANDLIAAYVATYLTSDIADTDEIFTDLITTSLISDEDMNLYNICLDTEENEANFDSVLEKMLWTEEKNSVTADIKTHGYEYYAQEYLTYEQTERGREVLTILESRGTEYVPDYNNPSTGRTLLENLRSDDDELYSVLSDMLGKEVSRDNGLDNNLASFTADYLKEMDITDDAPSTTLYYQLLYLKTSGYTKVYSADDLQPGDVLYYDGDIVLTYDTGMREAYIYIGEENGSAYGIKASTLYEEVVITALPIDQSPSAVVSVREAEESSSTFPWK